jgi:hypothetical protein
MTAAFVFSLLISLAWTSPGPAGQDLSTVDTARVLIPDNVRARELSATPVVVLGDDAGEGILSDDVRISMDGSGRFYVSDPITSPGRLLVFDSLGTFLRAMGRRGEGPGEFQYPRPPWFAEGDTMHVFDPVLSRWTVLTPEGAIHDTRVAHIQPISATSIQFVEDRLVLAGISHLPDRIGYPLHIVDASGRIVGSFGLDNPTYTPDRFGDFSRLVAALGDSRFVATRTNSYEFEVWDLDGSRLQAFARTSSELADWAERPPGPPWESPPKLTIEAIEAEGDRYLWVLIRSPAPDWEPEQCPRTDDDGRCRFYADELDAFFQTIIEVIDLHEARLVARSAFPGRITGLLAPGLAYRYRPHGRYEVLRLSH